MFKVYFEAAEAVIKPISGEKRMTITDHKIIGVNRNIAAKSQNLLKKPLSSEPNVLAVMI